MNENWEVNLLVGDGDVEGYNKFKLVYVTSTQERYKLDQNVGTITGQQPIVLEHVGDVNAPEPARLVEANKLGNWRLSVFDDENSPPNWDSIFNNTSILTRHFSGASSTAARHTVNGTAEEVRVQVIAEGATNATYYTVQSGYADTSRSYWTPESQQSDGTTSQRGAWFIPIFFTFEDSGKGDPSTLRNDLLSSPHMIEDTNADGLADNLTLIGTPAKTIASLSYLIGGKSQNIITSGANEGVYVLHTAVGIIGDTAVAKGYIKIATASRSITCQLRNGSTTIIDSAIMPADATQTIIGPDGAAWYEFNLSGTATATTGWRLYIYAVDSGTSFFIDGLYLQEDTLTVPNGWCSSSTLKNRLDPVSTTAATRQQINYLDVALIPGDLPAILKTKLSYASADADSLILAKREYGTSSPAGVPHFFDSADFNVTSTGYTVVVDATRIGGSYLSCPAGAALNRTNAVTFPSSGEPDFMNSSLRCFLVMRTTNALASAAVRVNNGGSSILNENIAPAAINTWAIVDAGEFNVKGLASDATTISSWAFNVELRATGTAGDVHFDGVYLLPTFEFMTSPLDNPNINTNFIINGLIPESFIQGSDGQYKRSNNLGGIYHLLPFTENRLIVVSRGDNGTSAIEDHDIDTEFTVELTVWPCTSHLLGTK